MSNKVINKESEYFLAIDIGASSGRHILGYIKNNKLKIEEIHRFRNVISEVHNRLCWDLELLFSEIINGLKICKEIGKLPSSMAIDTWGIDFVLLNNYDEVIGDAVSYRDGRTWNIPKEIYNFLSKEEIYRRTGIQELIFNTINQIYAIKKYFPEYLKEARCFLMIPDYFNFLLTGKKINEYTNASTTQLLNLSTSNWDFDILKAIDIPTGIFQEILRPGVVLGRIKREIKNKIGFDLEVIIAPSHDTASAVLSVPSVYDNFLYLSSGTWSLLGTESNKPNSSLKSFKSNFTNEGGYDNKYRYLKNIMGLWIIQNIKKELKNKYTFTQLSDMAKRVNYNNLIIDVNDNVFLSPVSMIEAVKDYCKTRFDFCPDTITDILNIVYNSLAKNYAKYVNDIENLLCKKFDNLFIVGGGSKDDYLNLLTATETKLTVFAGPAEATAIGNIVCQMLCKGFFSSVKEARNFIFNSFPIKKFIGI